MDTVGVELIGQSLLGESEWDMSDPSQMSAKIAKAPPVNNYFKGLNDGDLAESVFVVDDVDDEI